MDYKKKYMEALERAKKMLASKRSVIVEKQALETIFPELAESEDEKIRKEIISIVKSYRESCITEGNHRFEECLTWLKKQGKKANPYSGISFEYNGHTWGMCARDNGVDILFDYELINHLKKPNEQKLTDKVVRKFMIGDWVAADNSFLRSPVKIVDASNAVYRIEDVEGCSSGVDIHYLDRHYHLWTIQDAEDGDILFALPTEISDSQLIIFSGINSDNKIKYHCRILDDKYLINDGIMGYDHKCFAPATKDQRDILFQKMGELGYIWDDKTKMLSRIQL